MPQRQYKLTSPKRGRKDRTIAEFLTEGSGPLATVRRTEFLSLPAGTPHEALYDITTALQRAYEAGREDRAAEGEQP